MNAKNVWISAMAAGGHPKKQPMTAVLSAARQFVTRGNMFPYSVVVRDERDKVVFALPLFTLAEAWNCFLWHKDTSREMLDGDTVALVELSTGENVAWGITNRDFTDQS